MILNAMDPHDRVTIDTGTESRTKQSFKDECDINFILANWQKTGVVHSEAFGKPHYGDYTNAVDYQTAVNTVKEAEDSFAAMPSEIREKMHGNPVELLEFVADPGNTDEMIELGLVDKPAEIVDPSTVNIPPPGTPPIEGGE